MPSSPTLGVRFQERVTAMIAQKGSKLFSQPDQSTQPARRSWSRRLARAMVLWVIGVLVMLFCRVHDEQVGRVPMEGPLIVALNHINFLDIPVVYTALMPRPITGLVKVESWHNPFLRAYFNLIEAIPVHRGEADMAALRKGVSVTKAGYLLGIAPEGTRTGDGRLIQGHQGVAMLALLSKAPILPAVHYGGENFWRNLKRLRRTDVYINVGRPFYLDPGARG